MDNALMGLEEANVAAEQGKRYFMNALRRAKNMRKNRPQHMSMNELCVFDNYVNCNQAQIFEHVLKQRKMLKRSFNMRSKNNEHVVESRSDVLQNFGPQRKLGDCSSDREKIEFYIESLNQYKKVTHIQLQLVLDSIIQLVTLMRGFPSQEFLVLRSKLYNAIFLIISRIKKIQDISGKDTCESELICAMPLVYNAISLVLYLVNEHTVGGEAASKQFIILAIKLLKIRTEYEDVSNFESNTYRIFKTRLDVLTGQISDLNIKKFKTSVSVVQENHIPYIKQSKCLHFDLILLRFLSIHNFEKNTMERNDGSRQFQNIFKDEFRKLGGMEIILSWMKLEIKKVTAFVTYLSDHKFKTGLNIETKNELPSQTILRMTMILKLFESLSLSCHENREKMSQDEVLVATLIRSIFICSICISQVVSSQTILSTELILVCIENAMRVLINVTNGNSVAIQNVAKVTADFANISRSGLGAIAYVLQLGVEGKYASKRLKDGKEPSGDPSFSIAHFDMSILALALLTNCLEHYIPSLTTIDTLRITSDEIPLIEYLLNLFSKCRYFRKVQAIINDEFVILEGHLGLLFTCMIRKKLYRHEILNSLPNKPFETLHEAIALYANFRENCGMPDSSIK